MAVSINKVKCNGCRVCADICPANAIKIKQKKAVASDQ